MTKPAANLRDLFEGALALDPDAREAYLGRCGADAIQRSLVERMLTLDADRAECLLDRSFDTLLEQVGAAESSAPPPPGTIIGPFTLLDKLGEGGSSIVYRAERVQAGVKQSVALKLLRRGVYDEHERRRFRDERRALAQLHHPGIARLIEGGVTDAGVAYIALELVDGEPITTFAQIRQLALRQRLRLFVDVCRAVEAAHRALIVHRDLKPSNVLVAGEGEVKLLDFGIAKWLDTGDNETQTQRTALTPAYAAPEQLTRGVITTATDVYALGVLLDELITGRRREPGDGRVPSASVTALSGTPGKNLRRELRGDLDNIVTMATATEPERRYASARAFADDIERHLAAEPVAAHPPSRWYRTAKFISRHKGGVSAAAMLLVAILVTFGIVLWQEQIVRNEARRANAVRDFLISVFDAARAHLPRDARPTPEALVQQAQKRLAAATGIAPDTRADLLRTLGEVELSLADFARAQTLFEQARALADQTGDTPSARVAQVLHADALQRSGKNAEAFREVNAVLGALRDSPSPLTIRALGVLAESEHMSGANHAAIAHRREAQRMAIKLYGENSREAIAAGFEVGDTLAEAEEFREAIAELEPLLARWRTQRGPEDDRYVAALDNLATAEDGVGDSAQSEARFRELLALKRRIYTAPHDAIAKTLRDLSAVEAREEKYADAENLADEALDMQRKVFGDNHREVAMTYNQLAEIMVQQRRYAEAETDFRAAIAICAHAGLHEEVCPVVHNNFGMALYRQGKLDEAKAEMTEALAENRALYGNHHPEVAYSLSTLSNVAAKRGAYAEAVRLSAESLAILDHNGVGASIEAALIRFSYAYALWKAQHNAEALRQIDRTLADWQRLAPDGRSRHVTMLMQKAFILRDLNRGEEARRIANAAIALGVDPTQLSPTTKKSLRELSGRSDVYPEVAGRGDIPAW